MRMKHDCRICAFFDGANHKFLTIRSTFLPPDLVVVVMSCIYMCAKRESFGKEVNTEKTTFLWVILWLIFFGNLFWKTAPPFFLHALAHNPHR
ncbi:MAG: hypothetical protein EB059_03995 [Alphaproteobacteria bacterium]|nr:hypothetical protein [Alphaproteobacteria bacterium]